MSYTKVTKRCPCCDKKFSGHPNKRFCKQKCKDTFHNRNNPRGYYAHLNPSNPGYDPHLSDMERDTHPFSSEALGQ